MRHGRIIAVARGMIWLLVVPVATAVAAAETIDGGSTVTIDGTVWTLVPNQAWIVLLVGPRLRSNETGRQTPAHSFRVVDGFLISLCPVVIPFAFAFVVAADRDVRIPASGVLGQHRSGCRMASDIRSKAGFQWFQPIRR